MTAPNNTAGNALLQVRGLRRCFGGLVAVDDVSFTVNTGRIKAVIGPNGAGKTTLFNTISGLLVPDTGEVYFDERRMTGLPPYRIARLGIARTFQSLSLFANMTVLENVMVGCHSWTRAGLLSSVLCLPRQRFEERAIREAAHARLEFVGLADMADVDVGALPFGKRRMVELARALAAKPRLLLLDEPASGLNTKETEDLAGTITRIRDLGVTVLLVEHDMSLVMDISDEILVLDYGRTVLDSDPATVRNNKNVIAIYLGGDFDSAPH